MPLLELALRKAHTYGDTQSSWPWASGNHTACSCWPRQPQQRPHLPPLLLGASTAIPGPSLVCPWHCCCSAGSLGWPGQGARRESSTQWKTPLCLSLCGFSIPFSSSPSCFQGQTLRDVESCPLSLFFFSEILFSVENLNFPE